MERLTVDFDFGYWKQKIEIHKFDVKRNDLRKTQYCVLIVLYPSLTLCNHYPPYLAQEMFVRRRYDPRLRLNSEQ